MLIQLNTDKNVTAGPEFATEVEEELRRSLDRFASHITRIEVHFQDENAEKGGANDKRCMLEARMRGVEPLAVTNTADSLKGALVGARDKLARVLERKISKNRPPKGLDPYDQPREGPLSL